MQAFCILFSRLNGTKLYFCCVGELPCRIACKDGTSETDSGASETVNGAGSAATIPIGARGYIVVNSGGLQRQPQ